MLFTVILEFEGTNSVSQFTATDANEAFMEWMGGLNEPARYGLTRAQGIEIASTLADRLTEGIHQAPVALEGLRNVWCVATSTDREPTRFILLNIIATVGQDSQLPGPERRG